MSTINVVALNCTLKPSPAESNTEALLDKVLGHLEDLGAMTETVRVVDYNVPFGVESDLGEGDEWPYILDKLTAADIIIIATPIWFGVRGSVAQLVIERLDGTYRQIDPETGQFPLYGKIAGVVVTGNEDGAHDASATTLYNLSHFGLVVPPNVDCYWVGDAGPGASYIQAGGNNHVYTNRGARLLAYNTYHFAKVMAANPIPTNLIDVQAEAMADA
ncbi:MAG: flavodoxin family protein [Acidimicrobiales bacterium]